MRETHIGPLGSSLALSDVDVEREEPERATKIHLGSSWAQLGPAGSGARARLCLSSRFQLHPNSLVDLSRPDFSQFSSWPLLSPLSSLLPTRRLLSLARPLQIIIDQD